MRVTAFHNQSGSVGKSTLSCNVAWKLSKTKKTILIDIYPQECPVWRNASSSPPMK